MIVAGLDVGNQTTELVLAEVDDGRIAWLDLLLGRTSGVKGSTASLETAVRLVDACTPRPERILLPELMPVRTSDVVVEFAQEGAGPLVALRTLARTPGSPGYASGRLVPLASLTASEAGGIEEPWIVAVPSDVEFDHAAALIAAVARSRRISGVACAGDDGVLIANRLSEPVPIVDEVVGLERLPPGVRVSIEVGEAGRSVQRLGDPLFVAATFGADGAAAIAALVGAHKAAVVAEVDAHDDPAPPPSIRIGLRDGRWHAVDVFDLSSFLASDVPAGHVSRVSGADPRLEPLLAAIPPSPRDIFAVDLPGRSGDWLERGGRHLRLGVAALAGEPPEPFASRLASRAGIPAHAVGSEAKAAAAGAATTPGAEEGTAVCDIGAGTLDLAGTDEVRATAAGAGDLVSLALAAWAGLPLHTAELAKQLPAVEIIAPRLVADEQGGRRWLEQDAPTGSVGGLALDGPDGLVVIPGRSRTLVEFTRVRREIKARILAANLRRCVGAWPTPPARVLFAGGGALDPELLETVRAALPDSMLVGRANVAGRFGARGAVAAGAVVLGIGGAPAA